MHQTHAAFALIIRPSLWLSSSTSLPLKTSAFVVLAMGVMMYRCLHGQALRYLADHLIPASVVAFRLRLRSANRHQLIVLTFLAADSAPTAVGLF